MSAPPVAGRVRSLWPDDVASSGFGGIELGGGRVEIVDELIESGLIEHVVGGCAELVGEFSESLHEPCSGGGEPSVGVDGVRTSLAGRRNDIGLLVGSHPRGEQLRFATVAQLFSHRVVRRAEDFAGD